MQRHHVRRKRRQDKMRLRSKGKFRVNHKHPGGRTGSIQSRRQGKRSIDTSDIPEVSEEWFKKAKLILPGERSGA